MTNKEKYKALCTQFDLPIFMQDWWMDVVCGEENWQPILVENRVGELQAAMTCYFHKKLGMKMIIPANLTPFSGIWFRPKQQAMKSHSIAEREIELTQQLIEQLPNLPLIIFQTHFSFQNWLSFYWRGFQQTTRYTYILEDLSNLDSIFDNFKGNIRTDIKKAERIVSITKSSNCNIFYDFINEALTQKGVKLPFSKDTLLALDKTLMEKEARQIYWAKDENNNLHAAIYSVWDKQTTYLLLTGVNRQFSNSSALSLLIWEAIKDASNRSQSFDFEGSMLPKIEPFFRSFGAERKSYYRISKAKNRFWHTLFSFLKKI